MNNANPAKTRMLSGIIEVKELSHPQDVNSHIKQGWKLLETYTSNSTHEPQLIKYCVGWPKSAGTIHHLPSMTQHNMSDKENRSYRKNFIYSL